MSTKRSLALRAQDPIAIVIATVIGIAAELGAFDAIGLSASGVAQLLAGCLALAGILRHVMEKKRDADIEAILRTARVARQGIKEGGFLEAAPGDVDLDPQSAIETEDGDGDGEVAAGRRVKRQGGHARVGSLMAMAMAMAMTTTGCAAIQKLGLSDLVHRIDVQKAAQCAGLPDNKSKAQCLGVSVLSDSLAWALDRAGKAAEEALVAANPGAGADDMSDADRRKMASELDEALDDLAIEIARSQ